MHVGGDEEDNAAIKMSKEAASEDLKVNEAAKKWQMRPKELKEWQTMPLSERVKSRITEIEGEADRQFHVLLADRQRAADDHAKNAAEQERTAKLKKQEEAQCKDAEEAQCKDAEEASPSRTSHTVRRRKRDAVEVVTAKSRRVMEAEGSMFSKGDEPSATNLIKTDQTVNVKKKRPYPNPDKQSELYVTKAPVRTDYSESRERPPGVDDQECKLMITSADELYVTNAPGPTDQTVHSDCDDPPPGVDLINDQGCKLMIAAEEKKHIATEEQKRRLILREAVSQLDWIEILLRNLEPVRGPKELSYKVAGGHTWKHIGERMATINEKMRFVEISPVVKTVMESLQDAISLHESIQTKASEVFAYRIHIVHYVYSTACL